MLRWLDAQRIVIATVDMIMNESNQLKKKKRASAAKSEVKQSKVLNIVDSLSHEHVLTEQLLNAMQEQVDNLNKKNDVDYPLLSHMLHYFNDYPDKYHHPREDLLFQRLLKRAPRYIGDIKELEAQHVDLHNDCEYLLVLIKNTKPENTAAIRKLTVHLQDYIDFYRMHMHIEESRVFLAIKKELLDGDWIWVDKMLELGADPLFGEEILASYQDVSEYIDNISLECDLQIEPAGYGWSFIFRSIKVLGSGLRETRRVVRLRSKIGWSGNKLSIKRAFGNSEVDQVSELPQKIFRRSIMHIKEGTADINAIVKSTNQRLVRPSEKLENWREIRRK